MKVSTLFLSRGQRIAMALVLLGSAALAHAQTQEAKIGFVNTERIFREANPAKTAQVKIDQEFSKREKELQDISTRLKNISDKLDKDVAVQGVLDGRCGHVSLYPSFSAKRSYVWPCKPVNW